MFTHIVTWVVTRTGVRDGHHYSLGRVDACALPIQRVAIAIRETGIYALHLVALSACSKDNVIKLSISRCPTTAWSCKHEMLIPVRFPEIRCDAGQLIVSCTTSSHAISCVAIWLQRKTTTCYSNNLICGFWTFQFQLFSLPRACIQPSLGKHKGRAYHHSNSRARSSCFLMPNLFDAVNTLVSMYAQVLWQMQGWESLSTMSTVQYIAVMCVCDNCPPCRFIQCLENLNISGRTEVCKPQCSTCQNNVLWSASIFNCSLCDVCDLLSESIKSFTKLQHECHSKYSNTPGRFLKVSWENISTALQHRASEILSQAPWWGFRPGVKALRL